MNSGSSGMGMSKHRKKGKTKRLLYAEARLMNREQLCPSVWSPKLEDDIKSLMKKYKETNKKDI